MRKLDTFARPGKDHPMLADHVAAAERGKADIAFPAWAGIAVAAVHATFGERYFARFGGGAAQHERRAGRRVALVPVVHLQNLDVEFGPEGAGDQRLIIFNTQDGFDATRLLLPSLLERWRSEFTGRMVIGAPNRDFLMRAFTSLGENRREALKLAAGFRGEEAVDRGVTEERALDTVLDWLSGPRLMELALEAVELYVWDRAGSDN